MAYLNQLWFNRKIINTVAMATGAVHSETLTVIKRASKQPQRVPSPLSTSTVSNIWCPPAVNPSG